jgi:hypothetical protein
MKHQTDEELFAYWDGEMKNREAISLHLKDCAECRAELARLDEVFAALSSLPVPDPGENYGAKVWLQSADRLPEKRTGWWEGLFAPRRLMAFGTAVVLLALAFYIGRWSRNASNLPGTEIADASKVRERVLVVAVGEHLGKSEMILMELCNAQPAESGQKLINISAAQRRAEDLVEENRLYRQTALQSGDQAMASTLDELQRILLDVANSPDEVTPAQFESIQKRIASQGLLLKVRVVRQELRAQTGGRQTAPAHDNSQSKTRSKV